VNRCPKCNGICYNLYCPNCNEFLNENKREREAKKYRVNVEIKRRDGYVDHLLYGLSGSADKMSMIPPVISEINKKIKEVILNGETR
jgi:hypothetical protein